MTFYAQSMHVRFDANGNPQTAEMVGEEVDATGNADQMQWEYALVAADITGINAVVTNARAAVGGF
jgi:hypothetical protein